MIICKSPAPPDDHLQEVGSSGWPFAKGLSLRMIICKSPAPPYDHLQEAGPSGWPYAKGRSLILTTTKEKVQSTFFNTVELLWKKALRRTQLSGTAATFSYFYVTSRLFNLFSKSFWLSIANISQKILLQRSLKLTLNYRVSQKMY